MKNKHYKLVLVILLSFLGGINYLWSQETTIPDTPDEVRILPKTFKEEYTGDAYDYVETVSVGAKVKAWFIDLLSSIFSIESEGASNFFYVLRILFYAAVVFGVLYIILKMVLNKEVSWLFKRRKENTEDIEMSIGENIHEVDFSNLIKEAIEVKDYRLATRYYYLWLLKIMHQKKIIEFDPQKTTYDYQLELEGSTHATAFGKATYYYTYIWYGEFVIDDVEYEKTSSVFTQLLKQFGYA